MKTIGDYISAGVPHVWNEEFCSCSADTCLCQKCAKIVCGTLAIWSKETGNVCVICIKAQKPPDMPKFGGPLSPETGVTLSSPSNEGKTRQIEP